MNRTALLSVFEKRGIVEFAQQLVNLRFRIFASGGTANKLAEAGIPVSDVASLVGGDAILGHRVVTLSREVHAGLLARDTREDREELDRLGIPWIDLVCVDLYPLRAEIENPNSTRESVTEKTDIGGPALLRSAAKGGRIVICDPDDRGRVIEWLKEDEPDRETFLRKLAAKTEMVVARYCLDSARYHSDGAYDGLIGRQVATCLYGENAHQAPAALFSTDTEDPLSLDRFEHVAGTVPSYNNRCDQDRLLQAIMHIAATLDVNYEKVPFIAVGAKHGNLCGGAIADDDPIKVLRKMICGSLIAIHGGLVMTNFGIDEEGAETLLAYQQIKGRRLLDGIFAPVFTEGAVKMLERKRDKCRFLVNPELGRLERKSLDQAPRFRQVRGGFLRQPNYTFVLDLKDPRIEKVGKATPEQEKDLLLALAIGSRSNSNTITIVRDTMLIGNGVGQQDRVGAARLAVDRARSENHETDGAVAYSDSFFPFTDGPKVLTDAGIKVIFASSGSVRDEEVKTFCREHGVVLYLIPDKVGRGFFGH